MADRYWVGGTATWDTTAGTKWSLTSGGAGGQSVPTAADNVFFTAASGAATVTVSGSRNCLNLDFTGFTGTITGTSGPFLIISGNLTFSSGMTFNSSVGPILQMSRTTAGGTINTAGKTIRQLTIVGTGGVTSLLGPITATSALALTSGNFALNGFDASFERITSSGTGVRSISFGSNNINLTSATSASTIIAMADATNFTYTGTGGFVRNQTHTSTVQFGSTSGGTATNAPNLSLTAGSLTLTITSGSLFKNLNFTGTSCTVNGTANIYGNLTFASGGTYGGFACTFFASSTFTTASKPTSSITINAPGGTVTCVGSISVVSILPLTLTQGSLNLNGNNASAGRFVSNNSNTRSIIFGSSNIELTSTTAGQTILDMANATNFSFTGTGGFTRIQNATASIDFGVTGGTAANAPNLSVTSGSSALSIQNGSFFKNVNFTGSSCTVNNNTYNACGNLTLATGGTYTSLGPIFIASGTFTTNGKQINSFTVNGSGITVSLSGSLSCISAVNLTQGTFSALGNAVTANNFLSDSGLARTLNMGSGSWIITGGGATTSWFASGANLTVNTSTSNIRLNFNGTKAFYGGSKTYNELRINSTGTTSIFDSNIFNNILNTEGGITINFQNGATNIFSNFNINGGLDNLVNIASTTPGSQTTFSKASGAVNVEYLTIQDIAATGGATWNATNSTNLGNNTGWNFAVPSSGSGSFFAFF